jgi:outer membrane protein assembly factor BamB
MQNEKCKISETPSPISFQSHGRGRFYFCILPFDFSFLLRASVPLWLIATVAQADDWPTWRGANRDGVWREDGILEKFEEKHLENGRLKRRWTAPVGSGYSGPTVAGGKVFVADRETTPKEIERIRAFDWKTGRELWKHEYECRYGDIGYQAGPRASVTIDGDRAYALGARGRLHCLTTDGKVLWQHNLETDYKIRMPMWGIAATPLVEGDRVIVQIGGEKACLVAFDKATGKESWRALDDRTSYAAPIMIEQAGRRVLVCWTGDNVVGLDPATGEVHWKHPFKPTRMVIAIATPVVDRGRLFVSSFYDGSLMLRLKPDELNVEETWRLLGPDEQNTKALHSIISTPYLQGDYVYGVDSYGQLRCLDAKTGDRIWEDLTATPKERWSTIHMVRHQDRMFMFNERGELIIGRLSPKGFTEISRAKLIDPTRGQLQRREGVTWAHPAYAYRHVFARNDKELICASLAKE